MPKTKDSNKVYLNIKISKDFKYLLKEQSAREHSTMQDLILRVMQDYCWKKKEEIILEPLDEEDRKDLEEGKDDIASGDYEPMDKVFKELKQG